MSGVLTTPGGPGGTLDEDHMEGVVVGEEGDLAELDPTQAENIDMDPDDFDEGSAGYDDGEDDDDYDGETRSTLSSTFGSEDLYSAYLGSLGSSGDGEHEVELEHHDTAYTNQQPIHPYPHLREISSLASWTLTSHKPGCGIASLRHPSPSRFWQSDGPQPHILSLHFFKRVSVAHARLRVDFRDDESYTPTKLQIWAGTGHHDLQIVTEMNLEKPRGWLDVDLSRAGGPSEFESGDEVADTESEEDEAEVERLRDVKLGEDAEAKKAEIEATKRRKQRRQKLKKIGRGSTLRCFLLQIRILENHQNGKDTHLRGFQVFAKDEEAAATRRRRTRAAGERNHVPIKVDPSATEIEIATKPAVMPAADKIIETKPLDALLKEKLERARQQTREREKAANGGDAMSTNSLHEAMQSRRFMLGAESGSLTDHGTHRPAQSSVKPSSEGGQAKLRASKSSRHDARFYQRSGPEPRSMDVDMDLGELKRGRRLRDLTPAQMADVEKTVRGIRESDWMREGEVR
ncbi:MAG: anaphase promoting complex subunit doc1 [Alyxoria varia]|nr:MAG: anaphase promoting complex subunit doc1 [Alyxoria varia]